MPRPPQLWTKAELVREEAKSRKLFVAERLAAMKSEKKAYEAAIKTHSAAVADLLKATNNLTAITGDSLKNRARLDVIRYTLSPIVSIADLDTITDSCFGNWVKQTTERGMKPTDAEFKAAARFLSARIDGARASWLISDSKPTRAEVEAFVRSTASLRAMGEVATQRRMERSKTQEAEVRKRAAAAGYKVDPSIPGVLTDPLKQMKPGSFAPQSRDLAATRMDIPIRMRAGHRTGLLFLAIEAKVSNSSVNSRKRLNDVAAKAGRWDASGTLHHFRTAAVIAGVFDINRLIEAQNEGILIFWEHRLSDLTAFLR